MFLFRNIRFFFPIQFDSYDVKSFVLYKRHRRILPSGESVRFENISPSKGWRTHEKNTTQYSHSTKLRLVSHTECVLWLNVCYTYALSKQHVLGINGWEERQNWQNNFNILDICETELALQSNFLVCIRLLCKNS